jgi:ankyrin repeat protein
MACITKKVKIEEHIEYACRTGYVSQVEEYLKNGGSANAIINGKSLLSMACSNFSANVASILIDNGADVNWVNPGTGWPILNDASFMCNFGCVEFLLWNGADVNIQDYNGVTSLMWVSGEGELSIVRLLVEFGANVNHINNSGISSLTRACFYEHYDVMKFLIANGADVNIVDEIGSSLLRKEIQKNHFESVKILVENGACLHQTNFNDTYADVALVLNHYPMAIYLLKKGVRVSEGEIENCIFSKEALVYRDELLMNLSLFNFNMTLEIIDASNFAVPDARNFVCSVTVQKAVSILIGRETCPSSPFHRYRFPLDLLKVIFAMCDFVLPKKISQ